MSHENIWYAFATHPHPLGPQRQLLGKFYLGDGNFSVLEDHGVVPGVDLSKLSPAKAAKALHRLTTSQRRELVNGEDLRQGLHPDLLPTLGKPGPIPNELQTALQSQLKEEEDGPRRSSFDYHRDGMPTPQHLEVQGASAYLDGQPLAPEEMKHIVRNMQQGKAKLRHRVQKSEDLLKVEPHLAHALGQVRAAVASGAVHPDALRVLNRTIFSDTMVPQMGNQMAYKDFLSRPRAGVHLHLDANDFGSINKIHDHETGNEAIVAMGKALRSAMDESVGRKNGKLFRTGGDEFVAHVPTHEHAALFTRTLRSKLEAIPAIRGTHRLSMSVGIGPSKEHAEEALKDAKMQKKIAAAPLGQAKTHAASRMPGREGVIPVE